MLENYGSGSLKLFRDGSASTVSPETVVLHTSCLSGWALLSTLLTPGQIYEKINR